jgi:polyisoprenoid-binding protein YceI
MSCIKPMTAAALIAASTPALASPVAYEIDSGHTHIRFSIDRFGFADTVGVFPSSEGVIVLDADDPAASRVDASVDAGAVWSGLAERDVHVRGPAWLNIEAHPTISFSSTQVRLTGADTAQVTGDFTLLGVTRQESFEVTLNRIGPDPSQNGREAAGFTISGTILRSNYGHTIAAALIGDEVAIEMDVLAHVALDATADQEQPQPDGD